MLLRTAFHVMEHIKIDNLLQQCSKKPVLASFNCLKSNTHTQKKNCNENLKTLKKKKWPMILNMFKLPG